MQKWATLLLLALCLAITTHGFVSEDEIEDNLQLLFGGDDAQDDGSTQPGLLSAVQEFELALNGLAESPQSYSTSVKKVGCDECLLGGIRNVMQMVGKKIREVCEKTKCPKVKEMCIRAATHKELTLGFLIYKVRPVSHGFAYCFGSTSCDEKSAKDTSTNAASILVRALNLTKYETGGLYDFVSGTQDFLSHVDLSQVHHDLETQGADWIPISNRRELRGDTGEETECEEGEGGLGCHRGGHEHRGHHGGGRRNCRKCVRSTIGAVMQHVTKGVISYCTKYSSKNAKIKSWCRAGENNPKHAFGALLGAVAPWKFSAGYCFGHGECQAHRGGHRGGSSSYQDTDTTLFS